MVVTMEQAAAGEILQHLWSPLKNSHHRVKVQSQLLAQTFQKLFKMETQNCPQENHGSTKKK